jgi:CheY-like chemotaxis protein
MITTPETRNRVLIIEDERKTFEGWLAELKSRNIEADVATDPDEAVSRLTSSVYTVILLDLMLPFGSTKSARTNESRYDVGVEILNRIRNGDFESHGTPADVPVVVITANTETTVIERVRRLNPESICSKPESPRYLAEHIKSLLRKDNDT